MALRFERKIPLVLFVVFLVFAVLGFIFYQATASARDVREQEERTRVLLLDLESVVAVMTDAEADVRGFILTGNSTYADRFASKKRQADAIQARVEQAFGQIPEITASVARLGSSAGEFWARSAAKIERRKIEGPAAAFTELSVTEIKEPLDSFRAAANEIKAFEIDAAAGRAAAFDLRLRASIWVLIVSVVAGIISLLLANFLVFSEGKRRAAAEGELIEVNKDLEQRVEVRTEELRALNDELTLAATEREDLLAKERVAREEAEIANRVRDEFMAAVSHELRTPLNSILGWARLLQDGNLEEEQSRRALTTIIKNSELQNKLIEDLLDVARIVSGKLQIEQGEAAIAEVVSQAADSVRPSAEAKSLDLTVAIGEGAENVIVNGDANRLGQVVTNLLSNAIKFTPEGGRIELALKNANGRVEIEVTDTGIGISEDFLPLVFEKFRQDGSSENQKGLGLGLAIVRNIVELHGGSVMAISKGQGHGSTFRVILPVAETDPV